MCNLACIHMRVACIYVNCHHIQIWSNWLVLPITEQVTMTKKVSVGFFISICPSRPAVVNGPLPWMRVALPGPRILSVVLYLFSGICLRAFGIVCFSIHSCKRSQTLICPRIRFPSFIQYPAYLFSEYLPCLVNRYLPTLLHRLKYRCFGQHDCRC